MATIEATVIIPISLGITILLFWLGIYYYNWNVCNEAIAKAVAYGSEYAEKDNEEIEKLVMEELNKNLKDNLILADGVKMEVSVDYGSISASASGKLRGWTYSGKVVSPRLRPSMLMRLIH